MIQGKGTNSFRKSDLPNQRSLGLGFRNLTFAHQASGGETSIDLTNLTPPTGWAAKGHSNPSQAEILEAKLLFFQKNLSLYRTVGGAIMPIDGFTIATATKINLEVPAGVNEIFYGKIIAAPKSGLYAIDGRKILETGTLLAGETEITVGEPFEVNSNPDHQIGEVALYLDGDIQMRNVDNVTAAPAADGNYQELPVSGGLTTKLKLNESDASDRSYLVVSTAMIALRPDGSRDAQLEKVSGAIDVMIPTLAALAGVPETNFQVNPSDVDLKQFGDIVVNLVTQFNLLLKKIDTDSGDTGGDSDYHDTLKIT